MHLPSLNEDEKNGMSSTVAIIFFVKINQEGAMMQSPGQMVGVGASSVAATGRSPSCSRGSLTSRGEPGDLT